MKKWASGVFGSSKGWKGCVPPPRGGDNPPATQRGVGHHLFAAHTCQIGLGDSSDARGGLLFTAPEVGPWPGLTILARATGQRSLGRDIVRMPKRSSLRTSCSWLFFLRPRAPHPWERGGGGTQPRSKLGAHQQPRLPLEAAPVLLCRTHLGSP